MRANAAVVSLGILLASAGVWAQGNPQTQDVSSTQPHALSSSPDYAAVYCSDFVTDEKLPEDLRLISGEESNIKVVFARGDLVFLSKGSSQGVKVGDRFSVVRPETDPTRFQWFKWQGKLMKAMGTLYVDAGHLEVVNVQPNISTARVTFSCAYMQRGDIVRPMQERPSPPFKPASQFDIFAPVSGKPVGMLVTGKQFSQLYGRYSTVYVNLGSNQGAKVGDYYRIFRYQGSMSETAPNTEGYQYQLYGFGSTPVKYKWNDLPRELLGEGIVISVSPNSSTIYVTYSRMDMYAGDYAEIE